MSAPLAVYRVAEFSKSPVSADDARTVIKFRLLDERNWQSPLMACIVGDTDAFAFLVSLEDGARVCAQIDPVGGTAQWDSIKRAE
jgi:hypothetical protein